MSEAWLLPFTKIGFYDSMVRVTSVLLCPAIAGDRPERVKVNALLQANGRCDATKEREESSRSQVNIHFYHGDEIK